MVSQTSTTTVYASYWHWEEFTANCSTPKNHYISIESKRFIDVDD